MADDLDGDAWTWPGVGLRSLLMTLGLVCDDCSAFNPLAQEKCVSCRAALGVAPAAAPTAAHRAVATAAAEPAEALPEATDRPCPSCKEMVPASHRFCGSCGKPMPEAPKPKERGNAPKTMFFSVMQAPGRAKLILIKGDTQ